MKWPTKILQLFGFGAQPRAQAPASAPHAVEPVRVERFAPLDRLNNGHFARAHGQSINEDLHAWLPSLQAWCAFEYARNPLFQGVVNTFRDDVVGRDGPLLQVASDDKAFNDAVEEAWWEVFQDPDPSHRISGVEAMKSWVSGLLLAGAYVNIMTTVRRDAPISFGWRSVHARRLQTPAQFSGDPQVAFGHRFDDDGAPVEYYLAKPISYGATAYAGIDYQTIPATAVQHCYMPLESEQLAGCPLMAVSLEAAADLRDYDKHVMEAAKLAAAHAFGLEQQGSPEKQIDPDPIPGGGYSIQPGEVAVAPGGWKFSSLPSTQPTAQYTDFRRERGAELGRAIHMPLLVVFLTAADANFASAQYEGTVYTDGVGAVQGFLERRSLNPFIIKGVIPELALRTGLRVPAKYELIWTWNKPAHANIEKFVKAIDTMVRLGIIAPSDGAAMVGRDWDKVVAARKKCNEQLEEAGLPKAPADKSGQTDQEEEEPSAENDEQPLRRRRHAGRFRLAH